MVLSDDEVNDAPPDRVAPVTAYVAAAVVSVVAIVSPYFVPQFLPAVRPVFSNLGTGYLILYGVPVAAFATLVGLRPLSRYFKNQGVAVVQGLRWYGIMGVLALLAAFVVAIVLGPSNLSQLSKPNPVLTEAASNPWFWIVFSFIAGLAEETIFRGWIFGYWLLRDPSRWVAHAVWTSALFASVHWYYGITYGVASAIPYTELFFFGMGSAYAVRYSRGNLIVVGVLHGLHDAFGFSTLLSAIWGNILYYLLIIVGAAIALGLFALQRTRKPSTPSAAGSLPPSTSPAGNPAIQWPLSSSVDRPPIVPPPPPPEEGPSRPR